MAISKDDLNGNTLTIDKAVVLDSNKKWVTKTTKTTASNRKIDIDSELAKMIRKSGYAYPLHPSVLEQYLRTAEEKLGINHFSFHKLRHYFVSKCIDMGIDFITIRSWVGHNDLKMIQEVYAHKMKDKGKNEKMIEIFKRDIL